MSSWRCSHGQDSHGTGFRWVGARGPVFPLRRRIAQSLTSVLISRSMPGNQTSSLHHCLSLKVLRCSSCATDSMCACTPSGTTVQRPLETQTSPQHESSSCTQVNGMSSSGTFTAYPGCMYMHSLVSVVSLIPAIAPPMTQLAVEVRVASSPVS